MIAPAPSGVMADGWVTDCGRDDPSGDATNRADAGLPNTSIPFTRVPRMTTAINDLFMTFGPEHCFLFTLVILATRSQARRCRGLVAPAAPIETAAPRRQVRTTRRRPPQRAPL